MTIALTFVKFDPRAAGARAASARGHGASNTRSKASPAAHCNILHHTAPHCTTLHNTAQHCTTLHNTGRRRHPITTGHGVSKARVAVVVVLPPDFQEAMGWLRLIGSLKL